MSDPTTDHDLLIHVVNDVSHLRDDVAELNAAVRAQLAADAKREETREIRLRTIEMTQTKHSTRWRFFGWSMAILTALGGIVGLAAALT